MLTTLTAVKLRLAIPGSDTQCDLLLTSAIQAISARFEKTCGRLFTRNENGLDEFNGDDSEIPVTCYPIETITRFDLKSNEDDGWIEQSRPSFIIRHSCVISLKAPLGRPSAQARVAYTGGYVLPGTLPSLGQVPLPSDLEQATIEQVAFWYQKRDKLGLKTYWPTGVRYEQIAEFDLLQSVTEVLSHYRRWSI